ncbi:MAG: hypothetical protein ACRDH2_20725, partial [Anaerolineales bacterium]
MKRFVFSSFSLLLLLLLAACRGPATTPPPLPTATSAAVQPTAAPSNTPASAATPSPAASPTFTPTPTSTQVLTPTQTLTPTVAATVTPDPNQGVGDVVFEDRFDGTSGWGWTFQSDGVSFGAANGQLIGAMTRGDIGWSLTLGPDSLRTGDNQIRVVAQPASCSGGDEFGIFFRGALSDEGKFAGYLFKLNCTGQAGVDLMQN